ncbi:MAG TPA: lysozyme inhibitor LprI family protein [Sphingomonas sp.]|nr:lysozyme inhibitor LprI family protein [Sphingomonas sp.]
MILTALFFAQAMALPQDCDKVVGIIAQDQCRLAESLKVPRIDCETQMTQTEMNICSYRDFLRADIALNQAWDTAVKFAKRGANDPLGDPKDIDRLLVAQRAWVAFRDAHCAASTGPREGGGSMWPLMRNGCLTMVTKERTSQLREYVEPNN